MLIGLPTRYAAGMTICGDYHDLSQVRETIVFLAERAPIPEQQEEFILGLAYDLRHAYQGDRGTKEFDEGFGKVEYRCVNVLWPIFLVQLAMVRWCAGYVPTSRKFQADLLRLESIAEEALHKQDAMIGAECFELQRLFYGLPVEYLVDWPWSCTIEYLLGKGGKTRFKKLPDILRKMDASSDDYRVFEREVLRLAEEQDCSPHDLEDQRELPDFEW